VWHVCFFLSLGCGGVTDFGNCADARDEVQFFLECEVDEFGSEPTAAGTAHVGSWACRRVGMKHWITHAYRETPHKSPLEVSRK
jgi:hypothetical protein